MMSWLSAARGRDSHGIFKRSVPLIALNPRRVPLAKQLIVLIENRPGSLSEILTILAENTINVEAVMIEGSVDFGMLRLHVTNAKAAEKVLTEEGFQVTVSEVVNVYIPNEPGTLARIAYELAVAGINIECLFGTTHGEKEAQMVLKVSDVDRAREIIGTPARIE